MLTASALQARFNNLIPLSRAMEVLVTRLDETGIELTAPLYANHNHTGTGFAGSLYSLACLAGWGWLYALTRGAGIEPQLVLADGQIRYHRPCNDELHAVLDVPSDLADTVMATLGRRRRARAELTVYLPGAKRPAATFSGRFVALP